MDKPDQPDTLESALEKRLRDLFLRIESIRLLLQERGVFTEEEYTDVLDQFEERWRDRIERRREETRDREFHEHLDRLFENMKGRKQ